MISARDVRKEYVTPDGDRITAMHVERLHVERGEQTAVTGPSGSGKTTLLSILGGVLEATSGSIEWDGRAWGKSAGGRNAGERARRVGFVFQELNLIPGLTLLENMKAAEFFLGLEQDGGRALRSLRQVGLAEKAARKPEHLSRGERQRAAVARAILYPHPLLIADEPTASLDGENGELVLELLCGLARKNGSALLIATHDPRVMARLEKRIELRSNRQSPPGEEEKQ